MENKVINKKALTFLICVILIITLLIIGIIIKSNNQNVNKKNKVEEKTNDDEWYTPSGELSKLYFYYNEKEDVLTYEKESNKINVDEAYKMVGTYNCGISSCDVFDINKQKGEVIIKDTNYVIYDYIKNKARNLNLPDANYGSIEFLSYEDKDYGLSVSNINGLYAFYSLVLDDFTTDFKYSNIFKNEKAALVKGNISVVENDDGFKYSIVSYKNGKVIKSSDKYLGSFGNGNNIYYYENYEPNYGYDVVIYNDNFDDILNGERFSLFSVTLSGNLVLKAKDENLFKVYNKEGTLVKRSKDYKDVVMLLNDYAVVVDNDDYLKIIDTDANVVSKCMKMTGSRMVNTELSRIKKKNNEDGIFVRIIDDEKQYECFYMLDSKEKKVEELID